MKSNYYFSSTSCIDSTRLRNFIDIACNTCAHLGLSSALGALGSSFESCRPDSVNPNARNVSQACLFYLLAVSDEKGALKGALNSDYKYGMVALLHLLY